MLSSFIDVLICIVCKQSITDNKFKGNILLLYLYTYSFIEKLPWEIMDHLGSALVFVGFMIFILSIVGFTTTYTLWVRIGWRGVLDTTLCDKVCQWLATGQWFSLVPPVPSTNKIDHHDITEILLKVALSTINQPNHHFVQ